MGLPGEYTKERNGSDFVLCFLQADFRCVHYTHHLVHTTAQRQRWSV